MAETNFYKDFCKDRFDTDEEKIDTLMITVQNGLSHRMKRIERMQWLIASIVIGKIVVEFFVL